MGQCPMAVPTHVEDNRSFHKKVNEKNESKNPIVISPSPTTKCRYDGAATATSMPGCDDDTTFLEIHTFDKPERALISPNDVIRILQYQDNEMIKNQDLLRRRDQFQDQVIGNSARNSLMEDDFDDGTRTDITTTNSSLAPSVSPSVMSTARPPTEAFTDVTRVITNFDRYAPKSKPSRPSLFAPGTTPLGSTPESSTLDSAQFSNNLPSMRIHGMGSIGEEGDTSIVEEETTGVGGSLDTQLGDKSHERKGGIIGVYQRKYQSKHNADDNESEKLNLQLLQDSRRHSKEMQQAGCIGPFLLPCLNGTHSVSSQRRHLDALHLKMKAHLVDYYRYEFLRCFPDSPAPRGMRTTSPYRIKQSSVMGDIGLVGSNRKVEGLGDGRTLAPVRLAVDDEPFLDLAISGSLGLIDRSGLSSGSYASHPATPGSISSAGKSSYQKNPNHYLVLLDRNTRTPLAVCALKSPVGPPVVRIYATKPRIKGQKAAATTADVGLAHCESSSVPMYAWAEFVTEGEFPLPVRYSVYMSTGSDGKFEKEPSYRGSHVMPGSPEIMFVGRTESERKHKGCCIVSIQSEEGEGVEEAYFFLSISRGIDPGLFICLAAIVDETMENTMKKQCEAHTRRVTRRAKKNIENSLDGSYIRKRNSQFERQKYTQHGSGGPSSVLKLSSLNEDTYQNATG